MVPHGECLRNSFIGFTWTLYQTHKRIFLLALFVNRIIDKIIRNQSTHSMGRGFPARQCGAFSRDLEVATWGGGFLLQQQSSSAGTPGVPKQRQISWVFVLSGFGFFFRKGRSEWKLWKPKELSQFQPCLLRTSGFLSPGQQPHLWWLLQGYLIQLFQASPSFWCDISGLILVLAIKTGIFFLVHIFSPLSFFISFPFPSMWHTKSTTPFISVLHLTSSLARDSHIGLILSTQLAYVI